MLAGVYRSNEHPKQEAAILNEHLLRTADDLEAALRLQELCETANQPERVVELGQTILAIDPFLVTAIQRTLKAAESLQQTKVAVDQLTSLLQLQPDDAARLHFRIAKMLRETDQNQSQRHVLLALENAPRFREAHQLLLELKSRTGQQNVE
jgi:predicted TPR repeat methyltransferase